MAFRSTDKNHGIVARSSRARSRALRQVLMRVISIRKCQDLPFVGLARGQIIALLRNSIGSDCNRGNDYRYAHALFVLTFGRRRHCALFPIIDLALVVRSVVGPSVGRYIIRSG